MAKIISVVNHKGGVGKTTSAVNIGAGLNLFKKKVLFIDMDPQANLTIHLGFSPDLEKNIYGALHEEYPLPIYEVKEGLHLVPSTLDLSAVELEFAGNEKGREYMLQKLIAPVLNRYDYILIDCPPSLGFLTINALSASEQLIITVEPGTFALMGMAKLLEVVEKVKTRINKNLTKYKILITKYDGRKAIQKQIEETIKDTYKENVFKTVIRTNVALEEATMQGTSVFDVEKNSSGSKDYMNVCWEIVQEKYKNK